MRHENRGAKRSQGTVDDCTGPEDEDCVHEKRISGRCVLRNIFVRYIKNIFVGPARSHGLGKFRPPPPPHPGLFGSHIVQENAVSGEISPASLPDDPSPSDASVPGVLSSIEVESPPPTDIDSASEGEASD